MDIGVLPQYDPNIHTNEMSVYAYGFWSYDLTCVWESVWFKGKNSFDGNYN